MLGELVGAAAFGVMMMIRRRRRLQDEASYDPDLLESSERGVSTDTFYSAVSHLDSFGAPSSGSFCSLRRRAMHSWTSSSRSGLIFNQSAPIVPSAAELKSTILLRQRAQCQHIADEVAGGQRWYENGELLRYVRARPTLEKSLSMFRDAMDWRQKHMHLWGVDVSQTGSYGAEHAALLDRGRHDSEVGLPDWWTFLREQLPIYLYGVDINGLPISYYALGTADMGGLVREVGMEALQRYCTYQHDYFVDAARAATALLDHGILLGGVVIIDMEGLSWSDIKSKVQICSAVSEETRNLHPERVRRTFIVRAPRSFSVMWRLASTILDPRTVARITILNASQSLKPVFDELGAENVPHCLGGKCTAFVPRHSRTLERGAFAKHQARR